MACQLIFENYAADFSTDLSAALSFSVDNTGTVPAWLSTDESGAQVPLPAGTSREYKYHGDRYTGKLLVRFAEPVGDQVRAFVVTKTTHNC